MKIDKWIRRDRKRNKRYKYPVDGAGLKDVQRIQQERAKHIKRKSEVAPQYKRREFPYKFCSTSICAPASHPCTGYHYKNLKPPC